MGAINSLAGRGIREAAVDLCDAAGKKVMPEKICDIAKKRAMKSMVCSIIPVPGGDVAVNIYNMTQMYREINEALGIKTSEHMIATVMSATAANLGTEFIAKQAAKYVAGNLLKTIPGAGTLAGAALESGASAALTYTAACIYMNAITRICKETGKTPDMLSGDEIKNAVKSYSEKNENEAAELVEKGTERFSGLSKNFLSSVRKKIRTVTPKVNDDIRENVNEKAQLEKKVNTVKEKADTAIKSKPSLGCNLMKMAMNMGR